MENNTDYQDFYSALGLKKQATLADLKAAFREHAKRWHPDLAKDVRDSGEREERIREVNFSYDKLSRYYKKHHRLPLFDAELPPKETESASVGERLRDLMPTSLMNRVRDTFSSPLAIPTLLVSLFLSIAALVLLMLPIDSARRGGALTIPTTDPLPSAQNRYFTFGSTTAQVLKLHGDPEQIHENAWHYGDSVVYFQSGKVIAWSTGAEFPLRTDPAFPHSFGLTRPGVKAVAGEDPKVQEETD